MNFGFVEAALKTVGGVLLPVAEQAGTAAATAAGGPAAGMLANLAVQAINGAIAKHGASTPATAPAQQTSALSALVLSGASTIENITVGLAKKSDVMAFLEAHAADIANVLLNGAGKKVVDLDRFTTGADSIVEGILDVMKAIGEVPTSTPMTNPVVLTAAPSTAPSQIPVVAPATPVPASLGGITPVIATSIMPPSGQPTAPTITVNAADIQSLVQKLLSALGLGAK